MKQEHKEFLGILSDYQGIIHKVNLIYFKTTADREENFQEVVYQLWKSFPTVKDKKHVASWIYAVAINTSISKIRKDSRVVLMDSVPDLPDTDNIESMEQDIDFQQLLTMLQKLNEIDRSIMLLYLEDYNYNEIADILGISSTNVGVKINRAKKQLKFLLTNKHHGK